MTLVLRPIARDAALAFIAGTHRHNRPPVGGVFCASVTREGEVVGVGIAGRPIARRLDDGLTLEILRVCTDGTPNACSMLYGSLVRAGRAVGYQRFVTYTLDTEPGTSLLAAGFRRDARVKVEAWDRKARRRELAADVTERWRWVRP